MKKRLIAEIAQNIKNDNKTIDELIDRIMKNVDKWAKEHKGELKKLTPEQRERLTQPTYLVRQIAEIEYSKERLKHAIYLNLKRAPGNLREEGKILRLYDTLEKFEYKCPYSDTLLIGGEQPIHIDHIIPVTMGGPTDDWNCIPVCENCNKSKGNRHLLDWWQDNRTAEEEYKLVKIFEHITSKLLDNSNKVRYVETKDNTKHLDVITFLNQLLDHIEQNKQYILGPNTSILDDNSKEIESKLKELKKTFERVVKKNSDKMLKTDKQYFKEQKQMLKYVKGLGVRSYYKIAYTYFNEIQDMLNQGVDEEEIRQFCFDRDNSFNFTLFYEKLIAYKEKRGSFAGVTNDNEIGNIVNAIRGVYRGTKGSYILTSQMIELLNEIGFPWANDWFERFYRSLIKYKEEKGNFLNIIGDDNIGSVARGVRASYRKIVNNIPLTSNDYHLTQEMIDILNEIGFPWESVYGLWFDSLYEQLVEYKKNNKGSFKGITNDKKLGQKANDLRKAYKNQGKRKLTQEMIDRLNEIEFPWGKEDWFTIFYQNLIDYKKEFNSFVGVTSDEKIGWRVVKVRQAYKGKGGTKLTQEMKDKLNAIEFPWEAEKVDWFTPFYEKLIKYRDSEIRDNNGKIRKVKGSFVGVTQCEDIGPTVSGVRQAYKYKDNEEIRKAKELYDLTGEMIDKLNAIGFSWEARAKKVQEDVLTV